LWHIVEFLHVRVITSLKQKAGSLIGQTEIPETILFEEQSISLSAKTLIEYVIANLYISTP